jgi:hypothetical protein
VWCGQMVMPLFSILSHVLSGVEEWDWRSWQGRFNKRGWGSKYGFHFGYLCKRKELVSFNHWTIKITNKRNKDNIYFWTKLRPRPSVAGNLGAWKSKENNKAAYQGNQKYKPYSTT